MDIPQAAVAFYAGVFSFLSPCMLAVAPGYLGILAGSIAAEGPDRRRAVRATVLFVLGFSLVFILLGTAFSFIGQIFRAYRPVFIRIMGGAVILFALHQLGIVRWSWLYREKRLKMRQIRPGPLKPLLTGMAFAFGWTPCVGPVLGMILALAACSGRVLSGLGLLAVYSLGLAVPFLLLALAFTGFQRVSAFFLRHARWVELFSGLLLLIMGLLLFFNLLPALSFWLNRLFHGWSPEEWLRRR